MGHEPLFERRGRDVSSTRSIERAEAFLFGRRTYEIFASSWGAIEEMRAHPIGVALNERPKYVASTTLTDP